MFSNSSLLLLVMGCTLADGFIRIFFNYVIKLFVGDNENSRRIRKEILEVKTAMSEISMVDEFAKHARLQRRLIKLREEWKIEASSQSATKSYYTLFFRIFSFIITVVLSYFIVYTRKNEPVLILPEEWLAPLGSVISWPCDRPGGISVVFWFLASRCIATKLTQQFM